MSTKCIPFKNSAQNTCNTEQKHPHARKTGGFVLHLYVLPPSRNITENLKVIENQTCEKVLGA